MKYWHCDVNSEFLLVIGCLKLCCFCVRISWVMLAKYVFLDLRKQS